MEPAVEICVAGRAAMIGAVLMIVYDVIRFVRRIIPQGDIAVGISDILYWIFFTAAVFVLIYTGDDGRIRAFMFVSMACGMLAYRIILLKFKIFQKQLHNLIKLFKIGRGKE